MPPAEPREALRLLREAVTAFSAAGAETLPLPFGIAHLATRHARVAPANRLLTSLPELETTEPGSGTLAARRIGEAIESVFLSKGIEALEVLVFDDTAPDDSGAEGTPGSEASGSRALESLAHALDPLMEETAGPAGVAEGTGILDLLVWDTADLPPGAGSTGTPPAPVTPGARAGAGGAPSPFELRRVEEERDWIALETILAELGDEEEAPRDAASTLVKWLRRPHGGAAAPDWFLATLSGAPAGVAGLLVRGELGLVPILADRPVMRRRGVSAAAVRALAGIAREKGCGVIGLAAGGEQSAALRSATIPRRVGQLLRSRMLPPA